MDKENELWKFAAVRPKSHNNSILSFLAPRTGALAKAVWISYPERAMQWDSLAPIPDYRHYSPPPFNCLCNALYRHLSSRSVTGAVINGTGPDGCLPELDMFPLLQVMCLWYMCFCAEVFFFCSQTVLQMEHSLGVKKIFSSSLSSCKSCIFLNTLSSCSVYPVVICMLCMYGQVDGKFRWYLY